MASNKIFVPTMNSNVAWQFFNEKIGNPYGTAALVGGLYFVSGCRHDFGFKDSVSEEGGDRDTTRKLFIFNKKPFGIGGWKQWVRKQSYWNYSGKSTALLCDLDIQLDFIMDEFSGTTFGGILEALKIVDSVEDGVDVLMDGYFDLSKKQMARRQEAVDIALEVYDAYEKPEVKKKSLVKYVSTGKDNVVVWQNIPKGMLKVFSKKLGKMKKEELYPFVETSDDGNWFRIAYGEGQYGYVDVDRAGIIVRMEEF